MPASTKVKKSQLRQHIFLKTSCDLLGLTRLQDGVEFSFEGAQNVLSLHLSHKAICHVKLRCLTSHVYLKRCNLFGVQPPRSIYFYSEIKRFFIFRIQPYTVVLGIEEDPAHHDRSTLQSLKSTVVSGSGNSKTLLYVLFKFKNSTLANEFCDLLVKAQDHARSILTLEDFPNALPYSSQLSLVGPDLDGSVEVVDGISTNGNIEMQESLSNTGNLMADQYNVREPKDRSKSLGNNHHLATDESIQNHSQLERSYATKTDPLASEGVEEADAIFDSQKIYLPAKEVKDVPQLAEIASSPAPSLDSLLSASPDHEGNIVYKLPEESESSIREHNDPPENGQEKPEYEKQAKNKRPDTIGLRKHRSCSNYTKQESDIRDLPKTESMLYRSKSSGFLRPLIMEPEKLREELTKNTREEDMWTVDLKYISTHPTRGCEISPRGSVYMFTAHHMVPEYSGYSVWSSSSGSVN